MKAWAGRQYGWTLAGLVLAGVGMLVTLGRGWVSATAGGQGAPVVEATVTGRTLLPVAVGAAILVLAGVVGTLATRSWGRLVCGVIIVVGGLAATISAGAFALSAEAAGTRAAEAELGLPGLDVQVHLWWPFVVVFGLLAVGCGVLVVLRGRAWPTLGSKYERRESEGAAHQRTPAQAWDALDRGLDPTIDSDLTQ